MFTVDKTLPVNGVLAAGEPRLARSDVWRGLVLKGENALPFVPIMSRCEVLERSHNQLVREIEIRGEKMRERVTFHPEHTVTFERLDGIEKGTILNEILEAGGELSLRFTFTLSRSDMPHGSEVEKAYAASMENSYLQAVQSTINTIRRLIKEGGLAA
jgi:hypothetical protein